MQTAVGHKNADVCRQAARAAQARDEAREKEMCRRAASKQGHARRAASAFAGKGKVSEQCIAHVSQLQREFADEILSANISMGGTPTERFWADPAAAAAHAARLSNALAGVFPERLQPLCERVSQLGRQVCLLARCNPVCNVWSLVWSWQQFFSVGACGARTRVLIAR
jgi:hypothetical protein